ncbi:MAG: hypothetical protein LBH44_07665 [Treponema sp.]|jgi:hypothetical protein|nr:hypothetical protein [Treponema sp.]
MPVRKIRVLELARVGRWGLDGSEITQADIIEMAQTMAGKRPVIIGHNTDRAPKFGDVLDCWPSSNGNALIGPVMFSEAGDKLYEGNYYDGWSISMPRRDSDNKRVLHHLAILGAMPPKIPGLAELEQVTINFGEGGSSAAAEKDNFKFSGAIPEREDNETMTEEEKKAMADKDAKIKELEAENKSLTEAAKAAPAAQTPPTAEPKADVPPAAGAATGSTEFADMQNRVNELEAARRKERLEVFARDIAGKIPAGITAKANALAGQIEHVGSFDFSDNGKTEKRDALWLLGEVLRDWPQPKLGASGINFSDGADGEKSVNWAATAQKM